MVVGNGMISKIFKNEFENSDEYLIFASGVSNSNEVDLDQYKKEEDILINYIEEYPSYKFIYFSSVLLDKSDSLYFSHKKKIEDIIVKNCNKYLIFRLPQILGNGGNKNNIINYFKNCIISNTDIKCQKNTYRSIIDINDLYDIVNICIKNELNTTLNLAYIEKISIKDLISKISNILNKEALITEVEQGYSLDIENSDVIDMVIKNLEINKSNYTEKILKKYL